MIQRNRYVPEGMYVFSSHLVAQRSSCLWLVDDELTNRNKGTWKIWNSIRSGDWFKDDRSKDSPWAGHKTRSGRSLKRSIEWLDKVRKQQTAKRELFQKCLILGKMHKFYEIRIIDDVSIQDKISWFLEEGAIGKPKISR